MADTLDVLTYDEAIKAVGASAARDKDALERAVTAVSRGLDKVCGPIVRRTITDELHDGGLSALRLRFGPVTSVTTVTEAQGATSVTCTQQTFGTAPAEGFVARAHVTGSAPFSGVLVRMSGGCESRWYPGLQNVKVTYVAGRYVDTASVDEVFRQAAVLCLRNMWRGDQVGVGQVGEFEVPQSNFPRFFLPNSVRDLLGDEVRLPGIA